MSENTLPSPDQTSIIEADASQISVGGGDDGAPSAKRRCKVPDYRKTVTVLVGAEKVPILVHEDRICKSSKVFRAACSEGWVCGTARVITLPNERPDTFSAYAHWTYTGILGSESGCLDGPACTDIINGYLLGDRLEDVQYRNYTTDRLISRITEARVHAKPSTIVYVYNNTPDTSLMRKLLADSYIVVRGPALRHRASELPHDFVLDVAMAAIELLPWSTMSWPPDRTRYLEVGEKVEDATVVGG